MRHMGKGGLLRLVKIRKQRSRRGDSYREILNPQPLQRIHPEMAHQRFFAAILVEVMRGQGIDRHVQPAFQVLDIIAADEELLVADHLRGRILVDLILQPANILHFCQVVVPCGDVRHRQPDLSGKISDAEQVIVLAIIQRLYIQVRSRRHHPDDFPLYDTLRTFGILHLFADRHLVAFGNQLVQIRVHRVIGNAAHGGAFLLPAAFSRQCNLQLFGGRQRVLKEHFVKIPQSVK